MELGNLEELAKEAIRRDSLTWGSDGTIYPVNDSVILKVFKRFNRGPEFSKQIAEKEYNIGQKLFFCGINVPQMYGVCPVIKGDDLHYGLFMEKIYGKEIFELNFFQKFDARRQYRKQVKVIDNLGIQINDSDVKYSTNVLYDTEQRKLYLFDFAGWQIINQ